MQVYDLTTVESSRKLTTSVVGNTITDTRQLFVLDFSWMTFADTVKIVHKLNMTRILLLCNRLKDRI